ncbi:MAG: hypothetical protein PHO06_03545, partial [Clostridia bacterium]|nr:hypothetical protein [Clostridia bacterium]
AGIENNAKIDTMMNGQIGYMLNKAKIGTINAGEVAQLCDNASINTLNEGEVKHMMGGSMIYQQIGGSVKNRSGQAILIYSKDKAAERNNIEPIEVEKITLTKPKKDSRKIFDNLN